MLKETPCCMMRMVIGSEASWQWSTGSINEIDYTLNAKVDAVRCNVHTIPAQQQCCSFISSKKHNGWYCTKS